MTNKLHCTVVAHTQRSRNSLPTPWQHCHFRHFGHFNHFGHSSHFNAFQAVVDSRCTLECPPLPLPIFLPYSCPSSVAATPYSCSTSPCSPQTHTFSTQLCSAVSFGCWRCVTGAGKQHFLFVALLVVVASVVVVTVVVVVRVVVAATTQFISACTFETMNFTLVANGFCCKQATCVCVCVHCVPVCVYGCVCVPDYGLAVIFFLRFFRAGSAAKKLPETVQVRRTQLDSSTPFLPVYGHALH